MIRVSLFDLFLKLVFKYCKSGTRYLFSMSGKTQTHHGAVSESIVGRNKEFELISESLLNSGSTGTQLFILNGPAGIGKTTLIQKVLDNYPHSRSFKLYGKFENHRENAPYSAFRQAFSSWAQQILLLSDEKFDVLKEAATSALQTNITAVTDVFDELEVFFSRKYLFAESFQTNPHQLKARFFYFFKKFLRSITAQGYHLIFFLDDVQWCDKASLALLEELVSGNDVLGLSIIVAIREEEETSSSSTFTVESLKSWPNSIHVPLKPLSRSAVDALIPAQWNFTGQNREEFLNYLWLESAGNPLQIREILRFIQRDGLEKNLEGPDFIDKLPRIGNSTESSSFFREQLRNLPFHQLQVIATASCLGYTFTSDLLIEILGLPKSEINMHLVALSKMELLIRKKNFYIFGHDTIFAAANSLLSNSEKCDIHRKTGISLLKKLTSYSDQDFFRAVNHLNKSFKLSGTGTIYPEHIFLNLHAAKLAVKNTAFEIANSYINFADDLYIIDSSTLKISDKKLIREFNESEFDITSVRFLILFGHAETCFLLLKFEAALDYVRQALELECTRHQRLKATLLKMVICTSLVHQRNVPHILADAVESLEQVLSHFGIVFPTDAEKTRKEWTEDNESLKEKIAGFEIYNFSKHLNPDREYHDFIELVTTSMPLLFYADPLKSLYMGSKTLLSTFERGFAPLSPVLFSASFFANFLSEENINLSHSLGKLSLKMIEKEPYKKYSYKVVYIAALNFLPWENHYSSCVQQLEEGAQQAIEMGDPLYASFCKIVLRMFNTYRGKNLVKHLEDCAKSEKDHHIFFISGTDDLFSRYLIGEEPGFIRGNFKFPEEIIKESQHNPNIRYCLLLVKEKINYFAGVIDVAVLAGEECERLENVGKGFELEHFFYYSLSLLQSVFTKSKKLADVLTKVEPKLQEFKRLSEFKSGNFLHKVYLIEAEIAKCNGNFEQATLLYDLAIEEAEEQEFIHHAAIAAERAFEYYRFKGRMRQAREYLKKSLEFYTFWGAKAKVEQLTALHSEFISEKRASRSHPQYLHNFKMIREVLEQAVLGKKVSPVDLAAYLLSVIMKERYAEKAAILLYETTGWKVLALAPYEEGTNKPLHLFKNYLPVSVINYSIKTGEKLVLQDISQEALFATDPYLQNAKPENVSIFPVRESEETIGIIYLENCPVLNEAERDLFLLNVDLISTTFANVVYYHNNNVLNQELKLQEKNRIEAVIETQEKERQRIARDLHDSLGQILALSRINLSRINLKSPEVENQLLLDQVVDLIDESCREVRNISHNLMPPDLDNKSLPEILESLVNKSRQTNNVDYIFHSHSLRVDISVAAKFTLYRVLQEILQNIIKHASATTVTITLMQNDEFTNLLVEDNGKGFDTSLTGLGIGLKNIHSRIKILHGYFDIDSSINKGTAFNVSIPINV